MDAKLEKIIFNIQQNSNKNDKILVFPTLIHCLYLIDWKHTIDFGTPITNASWVIPYDNTFSPIAIIRYDFNIIEKDNKLKLSENEINTINFVINTFENKNKEEITRLIISTYPFITHDKGEKIDLTKSAKEYNRIKNHDLLKDHEVSH